MYDAMHCIQCTLYLTCILHSIYIHSFILCIYLICYIHLICNIYIYGAIYISYTYLYTLYIILLYLTSLVYILCVRYDRFLGAATSIYWNKQLKLIKKEQDLNILLTYRWYLNVIILMYIARKEASALTASMEGHKKVCMFIYVQTLMLNIFMQLYV